MEVILSHFVTENDPVNLHSRAKPYLVGATNGIEIQPISVQPQLGRGIRIEDIGHAAKHLDVAILTSKQFNPSAQIEIGA